jgi:hypothetical protein
MNFKSFGGSKIDSMKCSGSQVIIRGSTTVQNFSLMDYLNPEFYKMKNKVNLMNTLKTTTLQMNADTVTGDYDLIGISSDFPKRRVQSENSTLIFWDKDRKTL